jgi:hypothetical protein
MFQHPSPWRRSRCRSTVGATETKKTPRKPGAPPKVFHKLSTALTGASPVDVSFENETVHGKVRETTL